MTQGWKNILKIMSEINVHNSRMVIHWKTHATNYAWLKDGDLLEKSCYKWMCMTQRYWLIKKIMLQMNMHVELHDELCEV
jgi:hypothetical protein